MTYKLKSGKTLVVIQDNNPTSPREDSNLGTIVAFHSKYNLGDKHNYKEDNYNSWDELKAAIIKNENAAIVLPIYMYDHSGITIATTPFSCRWDSGQIGFIFVSKETIKKEYSKKRISPKLLKAVTEYLIGEISLYDQYLTGDVYGYKVMNGNVEEDSCWGFYGSDPKENGMLDNISDELE